MPKRMSDGRGGGRPPKRHLYLVLDDWSLGYSIRKVDLSSDFDCDDSGQLIPAGAPAGEGSTACKQRLPSAIFRFEAQRGLPMYFAAAFGTKLIAMHPIARLTDGTRPLVPRRSVPVFDVRIRSVVFGPRQMPTPADPIYIPVGGRLFALSTGSFDLLYPPPVEPPAIQGWVWSWHELPAPPFRRKYVTSYTVHPDGRTIFVSIEKRGSPLTFTFDTSLLNGGWKCHGEWIGCCPSLAVLTLTACWTPGLAFPENLRENSALAMWCLQTLTPPVTMGSSVRCDSVKLCKEKLFGQDPVLRPVGATLLYMGSRSEFCLVEFVSDGELQEAGSGCLLRLTTFFLVYDKNGNLTAGKQGRVRCYAVPAAVSEPILKCPVAFLM